MKQPTEEEYDLALLEAKRNVHCDATESAVVYEFKAPIKKQKRLYPTVAELREIERMKKKYKIKDF